MAERIPNSNLSPMAEPWGRFVTERAIEANTRAERLGGAIGQDGAVQNGQMDNLAIQIKELFARSSALLTAPDVTTPSYTTELVQVEANITVPAPTDKSRYAWVSLTGTPVQNSTYDSAVFITMLLNGVSFMRQSLNLPPGLAPPAGWTSPTTTGYVGYVAPVGSPATLTLRMQARGFLGDPARTTSLTAIQGSVNFTQGA